MAQLSFPFHETKPPDFDGATYEPTQDKDRLSNALGRVYELLRDGRWRTLREIACYANCSESGASARIRDLRKEKFKADYPNKDIEAKRVEGGVWVYRMILEAT